MKTIRPMNDTMRDLPLLTMGMNKISLPMKAQILAVGYDQHDVLQLTVILDENRDRFQDRGFYVATKGMRMPTGIELTYIGCARGAGRIAVHVFEVNSPEYSIRPGMRRGTGTVVNEHTGPVSGLLAQIGSVRPGDLAHRVHVQ